jgi:hypothetical protein
MSNLRVDVSVTSVARYIALFAGGGVFKPGRTRWYRGEARLRRRRALVPSIARLPSTPQREWSIYQRFRQNAAAFLPHATLSEWDWMLYMRHYGARTRLLDWTESPLVGLYFAVESEGRDGHEGAVWGLEPERLNELAGFEPRVYCAGIDTELDVYTPSELKSAPPDTKYKPAALIAARSFPRLIAQQGVFTVIHRDPTALETIDDPRLLARVRIPPTAKARIRASLRELGINRLSMFPELQSVPERI